MTFQWRGGYLTREVLQELLELIRKAGEERQKTPDQLQLATGGHSFQLCGKCRHPGAGVVMEDANEGEQFDTGE